MEPTENESTEQKLDRTIPLYINTIDEGRGGMRADGPPLSLQLAALRAALQGDARVLNRWRPRPRPRIKGRPRALPGCPARPLNGDPEGDDWPWDVPGDTPLHYAARAGDTATVETLLAEGANARACNRRREKPLEAAAAGGHVGTMRALLRSGAVADAAGLLRALWAARGADEVRALVEASPCAVRAAPPGATWQAAWDGRAGALRALLDAGADANIPDPLGWTPLHRAAYQGHVACVSALLDAGAMVDSCSPKGETPLHAAASWGRSDCLELLLRAGADASARNRQGATALHLAVLSGQEDAIRVLLQAGGTGRSVDGDMDCEGRSDAEGDSDSSLSIEIDCDVMYPFVMESPLSVQVDHKYI